MLAATRDIDRYFGLGGRAHRDDRWWVYPETGIQRRLLDGTSPFRKRAQAAAWIADDRAELAAFRDDRYGDVGMIGLVEALPGAASELVRAYEAAETWLAERGAKRIRVPIAGHVLYGFGFLSEGHDRLPVVGTTWSRPDQIAVPRAMGYEVARRFFTYALPLDERVLRIARAADSLDGLTVVPITKTRFKRRMMALAELRNATFSELWGDAPMYPDEAWELLGRMRPVVVPELALLVYDGERPVAMTLCFPDFNQAFAGLGREPKGIGAARALLAGRRRIRRCALGEIGVVPSHRGRGIAAALVARVILAMAARGYEELMYLLVLEDNAGSRRTIERFGARRVASHVVLEKR